MTKADKKLAAEFGLTAETLSPSAMDGNILMRERLDDVYDEISLCRGISRIGVNCDDEESFDFLLD